jgi:hypothetical protein
MIERIHGLPQSSQSPAWIFQRIFTAPGFGRDGVLTVLP